MPFSMGHISIFTKATEATSERGDDYWKAGSEGTVYYYSQTAKTGYWHYDENGNPAIWE